MKQYFVHIMSSRTATLYTGITNDLHRRSKKLALIESLNPKWEKAGE